MYRSLDKTDTHSDRFWDKTDTHRVLVLSTGPEVSAHEEDTGAGVEVEEVGGAGARDGVAVDLVHGSVLGKHNHISTTSLPHQHNVFTTPGCAQRVLPSTDSTRSAL